MDRVLITGAAGRIGKVARHALRGRCRSLRLLDLKPLHDPSPHEEMVMADVSDLAAMCRATEGTDCVLHLAGIPTEAPWEELLPANYVGTYNVFEAARRAGVRRLIFASSNHAVGFYEVERILDRTVEPRPDSLYGVSKVFGEGLGRLYADKHGIQVCALRIGSFRERPLNQRELRTWISPRDMGELIRCCVEAPDFHYFVAYGISGNTRNRWTNGDIDAWLGYRPQDNAEDYAAELSGSEFAESGTGGRYHGGPYCEPGFSGSPRSGA